MSVKIISRPAKPALQPIPESPELKKARKGKRKKPEQPGDRSLLSLRRKAQRNTRLSEAELERAAKLVQNNRLARSAEFAQVFNQHKHLTDEQLLERLQPWLQKHQKDDGRPADVPADVQDEKRLLAWRLSKRNLTYREIGDMMQLSPAGVMKLVHGAKKAMRVDPDKIDIPQEIGETLTFYGDVRGLGLAVASNGKSSPNQKMMGAQVALQAERDRIDFLRTIGVYTPQMTAVMQTLVIGSLKLQLGKGEHDMGKAVGALAKMLMNADLQGLPAIDMPMGDPPVMELDDDELEIEDRK